MKRLILVTITVFFLLPIVSADTEQIHDSWHEYKTNISTDGRTFHVELSQNNERIRVENSETSASVNYRDCSRLNEYQICYDNKSMNRSVRIDRWGQTRPGIQISILKDTGERERVNPEYEYEETVRVDEEARIIIRYRNVNNMVIPIVNQDLENEEIGMKEEIETSIDKGENQTKIVRFTPEETGSYNISSTLQYGIEGRLDTVESSLPLTVLDPYETTSTVSNTTATITFTNNLDEENISVTLNKVEPEEVHATLEETKIAEEETITIPINSSQPGTYSIRLMLNVEAGENTLEEIITGEVTIPEPETKNTTNQTETNQTDSDETEESSEENDTEPNQTQPETPTNITQNNSTGTENNGFFSSVIEWWIGLFE